MDSYIEITILPDAEMPVNRLLNVLYIKLHKVLCDLKSDNIGVSFPEYRVLLGNRLRIHGSHPSLADLQKLNWVGGVSGYSQVSGILTVPQDCQFRTIRRVQAAMSQSKLNRLVKRGTITDDETKGYKAKMFSRGLDNPYLELVSASTGHKYRRYIAFGELLDKPVMGTFDQFGISKTAAVPWF
ncbi:MAG: CRISPR-associated endonuclease Csy4 [Kiritimatiellia bacterium]|jgi:CRISPR-associated endonuclease Csy4